MSVMSVWTDIFDFLVPRRCVVCGKKLTADEHFICTYCFMHLSLTYYHTVKGNPLEKQLSKTGTISKNAIIAQMNNGNGQNYCAEKIAVL